MLNDAHAGIFIAECAEAYMVYDIVISRCGELTMNAFPAKNRGRLTFAPGTVSSGCTCGIPAAEINVPSCFCGKIEPISVTLEEPCYTICTGAGECIPTGTRCAAAPSAHFGDTVLYTITFTNYSSVLLKNVRIFSTIPDGTAVIEGSIRPEPRPGETLQTGVTIGSVAAHSSAKLEFSAVISQNAPSRLISCARAEYCYEDCAGCCHNGVSGECGCTVKVKPCVPKIVIVKSADKESVCFNCEEITYTLSVSNQGSAALSDVSICDEIPGGLCYKPCSTRRECGEYTDENPQMGIYIGDLSPGESYTVTFTAQVCYDPTCCLVMPYEFQNTACATGCFENTIVKAVSNAWIVRFNGHCLCEHICKNIEISDLASLCDCYIYHTGVKHINAGFGNTIAVGYGITVKYIDNDGRKRSKDIEDTILFFLPGESDMDCQSMKFTDIRYRNTGEQVSAAFTASMFFGMCRL